jgi:cytochrome P450
MAIDTSSPQQIPRTRPNPFDPPAEYRLLQEEAPVSPIRFPDGKSGWLLTRYDDVRAVLADPRFSSRHSRGLNPIRKIPPELEPLLLQPEPGSFIGMDPPVHTRYRKLLTGQFTVRRMQALAPRVAEIVEQHLSAMAAANPPVDLVEAFALPVPSLVICELLGVPFADRPLFQRLAATLLSLTSEGPELMRARGELRAYMTSLIDRKRRHPSDDLLSGLAHHTGPEGALSDEELLNIGLLLLIAGHETTANMLALGTLTLLQQPRQLALLQQSPEHADQAVEELLRYLTIVQFGLLRAATEDVEVGGQLIRAGDGVVLSIAAANRDPAHFEAPDEVNVQREHSPHLAFGHGVHQCLGQQLARVEMRAGFTALFQRFPTLRLAVPLDDVPMRDDMLIYGVHALPVTWDGAA